MPGYPTPSSGGFAERSPGGSAKSSVPGKPAYGGQSGGQIMISGPEEKALRVLELDDPADSGDDAGLIQQASQESGLTPDRVQKLKARAEAARNKGITLKGPTITLQPLNPMAEDGLLGADPMADVGGQATPAGRMGTAGAAGSASRAPAGGSMTTGATMSSAGLGTQRFAPSWRPAMSQATKAPPRMTPDVNTAGKAYGPAARPSAPRAPQSFSGSSNWRRESDTDPALSRAYRETRECDECGGTCRGKKGKHRRMR